MSGGVTLWVAHSVSQMITATIKIKSTTVDIDLLNKGFDLCCVEATSVLELPLRFLVETRKQVSHPQVWPTLEWKECEVLNMSNNTTNPTGSHESVNLLCETAVCFCSKWSFKDMHNDLQFSC